MKNKKKAKSAVTFKSNNATKERKRLYAFLLFIFAIILYGNTIPNDYSLDDNLVVYNHPLVEKGFSAVPQIFTSHYRQAENNEYGYRPITMVTFAIENEFFGQDPHISHFINILLYALLLLLLLQLLKRLFPNVPRIVLFFIMLLFAAHPLHTEVVASLKNREELLCFIFGIVAVSSFIRFYTSEIPIKRILHGLMTIIFLALSILSKQTGLVFCFLIPLVLLQFYLPPVNNIKNIFSDKANLKKYFFFLLFSTLVIILGYLIYKVPEIALPSENKPVFGFENPLFIDHSLYSRVSLGFMSLLFYLKLIFIPYPLCFYYGFDVVPLNKIYDYRIIFSFIVHAAGFIYAIVNFYRNKIISFAILFYLLGIIMFTNWFLPIPGIIGERLVFVSSFGFCIATGYFIYYIFNRKNNFNKKSEINKATYVVLFSLIIVYSVISISRNFSWKDHLTLYKADIAKLDNSAKANCMLADELMRKIYQRTDMKAAKPDNSDIEKALNYYKRAVEIYPEYTSVYNNIGTIYFNFYKDYKSAIPYLRKAVYYDSTYKPAYYNLALSYKAAGNSDSSAYYYSYAYRYDSSNVLLISEYANLENENGNFNKALLLNKKIMILDTASDLPYINIGNYFLAHSDTVHAIENWEIALLKVPENKELCYNLYMYFTSKNNLEKSKNYKKKYDNLNSSSGTSN
jgi:protein O-mannosyl-transferase